MNDEASAMQAGTGGNMLLESVHALMMPLNRLGTPGGQTGGTLQPGEGTFQLVKGSC